MKPLSLRDAVAVTVTFALATGLLEGGTLLFRRVVLHRSIWTPAGIIWMAPLTYAVLALPAALLLFAAARALPRVVRVGTVTGPTAFVCAIVLSAVLFGGRLHWSAQLMIALGVAFQLMRWAGRRETTLPAVLWRAGVALGAVTLLLVAGFTLAGAIRSRLVARGAAPAGAPNILLIIWDTVRAQNVSLLGYSAPTTPNLARWGAEGTVFEAADATAPWTLGGHAGMFTGLHVHELGLNWRTPIRTEAPTLAGTLGAHGYHTAGFVANLISASSETGLARGFDRYDDFPHDWKTIVATTMVGQRYLRWSPFFRGPMRLYPPRRAPEITDAFLDWSAGRSGPWFAFLNYFDAHDPYYPPPGYQQRFHSGRSVDRYNGAIALLDNELGRLLLALQERGVLDRTIVVVTSDHGELFGAHGLRQHGNALYTQLLHVPFVIRAPGRVPAGLRVSHAVSMADLPATLVSLALPGTAHRLPGTSLAAAWQEPDALPDTLIAGVPRGENTPPYEPVSRGNMTSLRTGPWHLIMNGDGVPELYHLGHDSLEYENLAPRPPTDSLVQALRARVPPAWHHQGGH